MLALHRAGKDAPVPVAEIRVESLSSQPADQEAKGKLSGEHPWVLAGGTHGCWEAPLGAREGKMWVLWG